VQLQPSYPVRTTRLLLRPLAAADADALLAYRSLPDVCRWVPFEPMTLEVVNARLAAQWARTTLDDEGQSITLGVERQDTGALIGDVMLSWHSREHRGGEIGYVFHPEVAGQGFATEAARAVLGLAFDDLGLRRVIARLDARNAASAGVAQRAGLRLEAHLVQNEWFKGEWTDELDYAILADEWAGQRG
jgi:RimJ/RimL family protein N-acetyltransferase